MTLAFFFLSLIGTCLVMIFILYRSILEQSFVVPLTDTRDICQYIAWVRFLATVRIVDVWRCTPACLNDWVSLNIGPSCWNEIPSLPTYPDDSHQIWNFRKALRVIVKGSSYGSRLWHFSQHLWTEIPFQRVLLLLQQTRKMIRHTHACLYKTMVQVD